MESRLLPLVILRDYRHLVWQRNVGVVKRENTDIGSVESVSVDSTKPDQEIPTEYGWTRQHSAT